MSPVLDDHGRVRAAGAIPWRGRGATLEVLVAHRPRYDDWTFPKGKADEGESDEECARREVAEEVGVTGVLGPELTGTVYLDRSGRYKRVRYWALEAAEVGFRPNDEVDELRWLGVRAARSLLSYRRDRPVLDDLAALAHPRRGGPAVVLVRHADATAPHAYDGPDLERPLTAQGVAQAQALARRLSLLPAAAVWSSPARRCADTAGPLAAGRGLEVGVCAELAEHCAHEAAALVRGASDPAILVSHGDVIPAALALLRPRLAVAGPEGAGDGWWPSAKASAWVLQRAEGGWAARYVPAPAPP